MTEVIAPSADICPECKGPRHAGWGLGDPNTNWNDPRQGPPKCYRCQFGYTAAEKRRNAPGGHESRRGVKKIRGGK